MSNVNSCW